MLIGLRRHASTGMSVSVGSPTKHVDLKSGMSRSPIRHVGLCLVSDPACRSRMVCDNNNIKYRDSYELCSEAS